MNSQPAAYRFWKAMTLIGTFLIAVGGVASYFDVASHFTFDFITKYYEVFAWIALIGVLMAFIGCIGWAKHLGKERRALTAVTVFCIPWTILLIGYPLVGTNIHGPAVFAMMQIIPTIILSVVLLFMAGLKPTEKTSIG
jgi:peptidoglycan/LPS O-acetylase OafA/YrhL